MVRAQSVFQWSEQRQCFSGQCFSGQCFSGQRVFQRPEQRQCYNGQRVFQWSKQRHCFSGQSKGRVKVVRESFSGQREFQWSESVSVVRAKDVFQWSESVSVVRAKDMLKWPESVLVVKAKTMFLVRLFPGKQGEHRPTLHCHHHYDSCIKIGSDGSHFNVSLMVTVHKPQLLKTDRTAEPESNRGGVAAAAAEVLLHVHKNRRLIRDGSPGRPPRFQSRSALCSTVYRLANNYI